MQIIFYQIKDLYNNIQPNQAIVSLVCYIAKEKTMLIQIINVFRMYGFLNK